MHQTPHKASHMPSTVHKAPHHAPHVPQTGPHKAPGHSTRPISHHVPRGYDGWTQMRWDARYGCRCHWHPHNRLWYYWYAPRGCYLPITYLDEYPPASEE
jgi:hypothetical protein